MKNRQPDLYVLLRVILPCAIIVIMLLLSTTPLSAQYAPTRLYTAEEGLPMTECHTVYVDTAGLLHLTFSSPQEMWAFDGQRFYKEKITPPNTTQLREDDQGRLWMYHSDHLSFYEGDSLLQWHVDPSYPVKDTFKLGEKIPHIIPISAVKQRALFSTLQADTAKLYSYNDSLRALIAMDSTVRQAGEMLYQYADVKTQQYILSVRTGDRFTFLWKSAGEIALIGSYHLSTALDRRWIVERGKPRLLMVEKSGFSTWTIKEGKVRPIEGPQPLSEVLPPDAELYINALYCRSLVYESGKEKFIVVFNEDYTSYEVVRFVHPGNIIQLARDKGGNFWAAGHSGLLRIFPTFTNFFQEDNPNFLTDLHAIGQDGKGNTWVGSYGMGIGYFRPNGDFVHQRSDIPKILPGSISPNGRDLLFSAGAPTAGLFLMRGNDLQMVYPKLLGFFFSRDRAGRILFGSNKKGLLRHKEGHSGFGPDDWEEIGPDKGFKLVNVLTALQDKNGRYWMGRPSAGMAVYLPDRDTVLNWLVSEEQLDFGVWSSAEDHWGYVWLGTTQGLRRFSPPDTVTAQTNLRPHFDQVGIPALDTGIVRSMAIYQDRYLILLAGTSFFLLDLPRYYEDPTHPVYHEFNATNGYRGLNAEQNSIWIDRRQRVWFVNDKGVSRFNPTFFFPDTLPIRVVIDQLSSYGDEFSVNEAPTLSLEQKHTNVRFSFHVEDNPTLAANIQFQYQLNDGAFKTTTENVVDFVNQQYGRHSFTVYALKNGVRSAPAILQFEIPKPFAETPRFYLLLTGTVLALITVFYLGKRRQDKRRQQLAMLRAQTIINQLNPHFINNALGWIQHRAMHSDDGQAVAVIQRMAKNIRTIFRNSRERKSHHPLAEELLLVENYFHIQQTRFGADFQYTMPTEEQLTGVDLTLNVPLMILQIHCENAVEHGIRNQEGVGYVRVDLHNEADFVRIVIEDNGVGRKKAADIGSLGSGQGTKMMTELFRAFNLNNHLKLHQYFEDDIFTKPDGTRYGTRSIILIPKSFNYELTDFLRASG